MSEAHYLLPTSVDLQLRQPFVHPRMRLLQPIRNSAPSRLQNLEDLYWGNMSSSDPNGSKKLKSNSLTNLFMFEKHNGKFRSLGGDCPGISSETVDCCDSPSDDVSPAPSPSTEPSLAPNFATCKDRNNNGLNGTISSMMTSNLLSQSKDSEHHSCHANKHERGSLVKTHKGDPLILSQLIRKDTFGIANLSLNQKAKCTETDTNLTAYVHVDLAVKNTSIQKVEKQPEDTEDKQSISSCSSDETFVGDDDDDAAATKQPGYFRSLSDSKVHHQHRHESLKRRKSVHFADHSGYELEVHIPISNVDDYETPPRLMQALEKLRAQVRGSKSNKLEHERGGFNTLLRHFSLVLNFQQPFLESTFRNRIAQQNVCLESVSILPNSLSFTGVVRVNNLEFEKQVTVRYSTDNWRTYVDIPACYVSSLSGCRQDQFSFHVVATDSIMDSGKIELAFRFRLPLSGREFWDNNYGRNYTISCLEHRGNHCDDGMMT